MSKQARWNRHGWLTLARFCVSDLTAIEDATIEINV